MATKKSIFQFGDMFGYNSPFQRDWVTEMREEREERERKREERNESDGRKRKNTIDESFILDSLT